MINEDKIRQVYASDPKKGFKMLMDNFRYLYIIIYGVWWYHMRMQKMFFKKSLSGYTVIWDSFVVKAR